MSWLAAFALGMFTGGTLSVLCLSTLVVAGESDDAKRANFLEQRLWVVESENTRLRERVKP